MVRRGIVIPEYEDVVDEGKKNGEPETFPGTEGPQIR
jgi:hypothetical protein